MSEKQDQTSRQIPAPPAALVPHLENCPGCGRSLEGRLCKSYCTNEGCELYRMVIENCAGD
ncbi:MAG: hypothetical protein VCB80_10800 [Deltaproteobacteria bacterium]